MAQKKQKRKSKKVSTSDFLDFLDDQEEARGPVAFKPSPHQKRKKKKSRLTPIQKEWLDLALRYSPRPVRDFVRSERTQKWIAAAEDQLDWILTEVARKRRL